MKALKDTVAAIALLAWSAGQPALADSMFDQGLRDRTVWEQWFNSLQGDYKTGAFYWSGQRSLPQPGNCQQMDADFYRGCTDTKVKFAPTDALRKTEPAYKAGWNSYAPEIASTPIATASEQPQAKTTATKQPSTPAPALAQPPTHEVETDKLQACINTVRQSGQYTSRDGGRGAINLLKNHCDGAYVDVVQSCTKMAGDRDSDAKFHCIEIAAAGAQIAIMHAGY